jgi:flagellar hook-associated protein 3 FlgL
MRILFDVLRDGLSAINTANRQLGQAQQQVATGRRILGVGDDPLGTQQAIGEHATMGALDNYSRTNSSASARLSAIDNILATLGNKLTAANVTASSARGTNVDANARAAASAEVRSLRDGILADINTKFQGTALFAGSATNQQAYVLNAGSWTYQGNSSAVQVEVERGRRVSITFDGQSIMQGSDSTDILTALDTLATAIDAGDNTAIGVGIDAIERAFTRTQRAIGSLGADERTIDEAGVHLSALRVAANTRRAAIEDVDMAEAVTRMTQSETAYRAALTAVSTAERQSLLDYLR